MHLTIHSHRYKRTCFDWLQQQVRTRHYLRSRVPHISQPFVYVLRLDSGEPVGGCIVSGVHQTKQGGRLCRPDVVPGFIDRRGTFRPTTPTWMIGEILGRIQRDRVALWPPVQLDLPYHIRLAVSYSDPVHHSGRIYQLAGALPMHVDEDGNPVAGKSGKVGWYWQLDEPNFSWRDVEILRSRQVRMF